jgi:hypothetical protein
MGDQPDTSLLPTQDNTNTNTLRQTSMPPVGFDLMIPVFERTKTIHDLRQAACHCERRVEVEAPCVRYQTRCEPKGISHTVFGFFC